MSESNHTVAWTYAPKHLTNSRETVEAAAILAAIHLNDGQLAMRRFLENLSCNISLLHDIFLKTDYHSLVQSNNRDKRYNQNKDTSGAEWNDAEQF